MGKSELQGAGALFSTRKRLHPLLSAAHFPQLLEAASSSKHRPCKGVCGPGSVPLRVCLQVTLLRTKGGNVNKPHKTVKSCQSATQKVPTLILEATNVIATTALVKHTIRSLTVED